MAKGGAILLFAGLGIGAFLLMPKSSSAAVQPPAGGGHALPPAPGAPPGAPPIVLPPVSPPAPLPPDKWGDNPGVPADLATAIDQELANDPNPDNLRQFALSLSPNFPYAAAALNARADALSAQPPHPNPPPPPPPVPVPVPVPPQPAPQPAPQPQPAPSSSGVFGIDATSWDPSWSVADPRPDAPSVFAGYGNSAAATKSIQSMLNTWAQQVAFDPDETTGLFPLTVDGKFGPKSAKLAANFQQWVNLSRGVDYAMLGMAFAPLTVDGIPGPTTMQWLRPWGGSSAAA